jgi:hypothetical protein
MLDRFSNLDGKSSLFGNAAEEELPEKLCVLAEALYIEKNEIGEWSGASTKHLPSQQEQAVETQALCAGIVATKDTS